MLEQLLTLIAPHECIGCGAEGKLICPVCIQLLPASVSKCYRCGCRTDNYQTCATCRTSSPLSAVFSVAPYEAAAKEMVWRLKFGRAKAAAIEIARRLVLPAFSEDLILVHIPTATNRVRQRGYDQARLIARHAARIHRLPHIAALARLGQKRQVGASAEIRRAQARTAFRVIAVPAVSGKRVLLIDDVMTSGATLEAAAHILKQAGAQSVSATVFARA